MEKLFRFLFLGAFLFAIVACNDEDDQPPVTDPAAPNLVEAASEAGLTTLVAAVQAIPGLAPALLNADAITVFAPTNQAFDNALEAFGASNLTELVDRVGGPDNLETVLGFHVVPAVAFSSDLNANNTFTTLSGQSLEVNVSGGNVTVVDATGATANVVEADVEISNGVVHVIDRVLLPDLEMGDEPGPNLVDAATEAGLDVLLAAVTAVDGLADALLAADAITVFAPTDEAFGAALEAFNVADLNQLVARIGGVENLETVLGFHVVPAVAFSSDLEASNTFTTLSGQDLTVTASNDGVTVTDATGNTVNVIVPDVAIENGVVHVIDGVLLPELSFPNIVEAATAAELTVLIEAVLAAGLDDALLEAEDITVFAPTNDAFVDLLAALEVGSLEELIDELGAEAVVQVLQFHVVPTVAFSFDLAEGDNEVPTLAGETLTVTRSGSSVTVTDAAGNTYSVVAADVAIENGVVHVIDGVLLPTL